MIDEGLTAALAELAAIVMKRRVLKSCILKGWVGVAVGKAGNKEV